ncbi:MAG: DNA-directed RNA polymerase subunit omega [Bacteroidales bacterium]|nr:DNA-directed RNA polymerase subunit omega [Bacteroidales bacterium]
MDYKKLKIENTTVTRKMRKFDEGSNNIYETVAVISKRANQIASVMKEDLDAKISEFATPTDNLEEIFENREQIEVSKYFEHLPKPTLIAINEYLNGEVYSRNPLDEMEDN